MQYNNSYDNELLKTARILQLPLILLLILLCYYYFHYIFSLTGLIFAIRLQWVPENTMKD